MADPHGYLYPRQYEPPPAGYEIFYIVRPPAGAPPAHLTDAVAFGAHYGVSPGDGRTLAPGVMQDAVQIAQPGPAPLVRR